MHAPTAHRRLVALALALAAFAVACGGSSSSSGSPPITKGEGTDIAGAPGWKWIPFDDAFCTDRIGTASFGKSTTGLAVSWGTTNDVIIFLQGGGACWDYITCGGAAAYTPSYGFTTPLASTGPFGPAEFATDIYAKYANSWIHRDKMPASMAEATVVFVPYCTGDVHAGDSVTTYQPPPQLSGFGLSLGPITWQHVGHANIVAFLRRLGPAFQLGPTDKLVVAGSSAGGFGSLANYEYFRAQWPDAKAYLVDDSGPPLQGDAIPQTTRDAWYASWNMGASLSSFCPECQGDVSKGLTHILSAHPGDRVALLSHTQDAVICGFFGTFSYSVPFLVPKAPLTFSSELQALGTQVLDPATTHGKYFFTAVPQPTDHPTLEDPSLVTSPAPGLTAWIDEMLSDSADWASAAP